MSDNTHHQSRFTANPVALSSYSVAICSFGAAVDGLPFSHWPSGALAAVGGFYLVVGLANRGKVDIANSHPASAEMSRQTSDAENLVAEAISSTRESASKSARTPELVGGQR